MPKQYVVAIPSYKRAELLVECTLSTLQAMKVPASRIHVFVANRSEYNTYDKVLPRKMYHKLVLGVVGLGKQRTFISQYFPENTHILHMDDDVKKMLTHTNAVICDLNPWVNMAFRLCKQQNCKLWGVYPIDNRLCMSQTATVGWVPLIGTIFGVINCKDKGLHQKLSNCEDLERSLQHIHKFGKVLRLNGVCFRTKGGAFYEGGLGSGQERLKDYELQLCKLEKMYPQYIKRRVHKNDKCGDWLSLNKAPVQCRIQTECY